MTAIRESTGDGAALPADIALAGAPGHVLLAPAFEAFCRLFFLRLGTLTVDFAAPLPSGPFMVCANHRSHADSPALMAAAGISFAQCGLLAAEDYYFRHPLRLRIVSSILRIIPVERRPTRGGFAATLAACSSFLETGGRLLIAYPEGTRGTGADPRPFKRGPVTLALRHGLAVVPAFISGSERVLPKGRVWPWPGSVGVRFGVPLLAPAVARPAAARAQASDLTERLNEQVWSLARP
ncbi:MAG TPA: lysophospholipid acyltransferase family protein [Steroidobacteraceae bacterium]|nr:lysophospholipid acyltransferase family protein [Steroidobacteraceae bacterium]